LNQPGVRLMRGEIPYSPSDFAEGIADRHAADGAAVLHVLGIERVAAGLDGEDKRPAKTTQALASGLL
jgi:hypothetical protein